MSQNFFSQGDDEEEFRDVPDEVSLDAAGRPNEAPPANVRSQRPAAPPAQPEKTVMQEYEENPELDTSEDDDDFSSVINDARFRLEQGRLFEMILNHNIFEGADADERAIKYVTKQIRNFAKEQMEIMLGMRQEAPKNALSVSDFPFNDLEVQVLKALASTATQGATAAPEVQQFSGVQVPQAPRKVGLNAIGVKSTPKPAVQAKAPAKPLPKKPPTAIKRRNEQEIDQILAEEGISRAEYDRQYNPDYKPLTKPLANMSEEEIKEWKRQDALKTNKQVKNPAAIPMPSPEQEEMLHSQRAQAAAAHPQMQSIMNLLNQQPKKK